jgi:hypothetical protein
MLTAHLIYGLLVERRCSPGPDGIRALSPHLNIGLLGPEKLSGSERAGLTYHAITAKSTCAIVVPDLLVWVPKLG